MSAFEGNWLRIDKDRDSDSLEIKDKQKAYRSSIISFQLGRWQIYEASRERFILNRNDSRKWWKDEVPCLGLSLLKWIKDSKYSGGDIKNRDRVHL